MAEHDQDQKTEQPTEKKLNEAWDRGQFARSPEQALAQLLNPKEKGFMDSERAIEDAYMDLQSHQMATLKAMQGALQGVASDGVSLLRRSADWALVALATSPDASLASEDEPGPPPRPPRALDE